MMGFHHLPAGGYFDDPAANLDREKNERALYLALVCETVIRIFEWILRGGVKQRSLRFHLVALRLCPQLLPCKHPSVSWCAREHGVSRQWANRLQQEFVRELGDRFHFRGEPFSRQWMNIPYRASLNHKAESGITFPVVILFIE